MQDAFASTWELNPQRSAFDRNHRPRAGTMTIEVTAEGGYLLTAEGVNEKGEKCSERPSLLIPDGQDHPVPDFPGLVSRVHKPDAHTITAEVRRQDGSLAGGGTYTLSPDGAVLTAVNFGFDSQLREFRQTIVWDRRQIQPEN